MLKICSSGHPEIIFDVQFCPCCDLNDQLDNANEDLDQVRDDYEVSQERVIELEQQLSGEIEPPEKEKGE